MEIKCISIFSSLVKLNVDSDCIGFKLSASYRFRRLWFGSKRCLVALRLIGPLPLLSLGLQLIYLGQDLVLGAVRPDEDVLVATLQTARGIFLWRGLGDHWELCFGFAGLLQRDRRPLFVLNNFFFRFF